ncbi:hypothetical protein EE612_052478, partial [Oryza sativa]
RIDIWVEKALWELALGWFARIVLTEVKGKRVVPTFPIGPLLAGDGAVPDHEVRRPVGHRLRLRHEPLIQSKQAKHQVRRNTIGGHRRCEKNRKKNHRREGGSSARPCAPPRGGRVRSLPTWRRRRVVAGLGLV